MKHSTLKIFCAVIAAVFAIAIFYLCAGLFFDYTKGLFSSAAVYNRSKTAFILILAGTLAAIILLIFQSHDEKKNDTSHDEDSVLFTDDIDAKYSKDDADQIIKDITSTSDSEKSNSENSDNEKSDNSNLSFDDNTEKADSEIDITPPIDSIESDSTAPLSLEKTLEDELVRAASSEQDLSLAILRIDTDSLQNEISTKILSLLSEKCGENLVFEYGTDGFAYILKNTTLDSALAVSENIESNIKKILSDSKINATAGIGIASRTTRLISAKRIITEADQAVAHAVTDKDSPIIAFRVDPEKYRQYLSESNEPSA